MNDHIHPVMRSALNALVPTMTETEKRALAKQDKENEAMTDLGNYYLYKAAACEAYAQASRLDAAAAAADPYDDDTRQERVESARENARSYERTALEYRRMAHEQQQLTDETTRAAG